MARPKPQRRGASVRRYLGQQFGRILAVDHPPGGLVVEALAAQGGKVALAAFVSILAAKGAEAPAPGIGEGGRHVAY